MQWRYSVSTRVLSGFGLDGAIILWRLCCLHWIEEPLGFVFFRVRGGRRFFPDDEDGRLDGGTPGFVTGSFWLHLHRGLLAGFFRQFWEVLSLCMVHRRGSLLPSDEGFGLDGAIILWRLSCLRWLKSRLATFFFRVRGGRRVFCDTFFPDDED